MSPAVSLLGFAVVIFLLLFLIAKWKWHVFFALLIPILLFGVLPGVQQNNFIDAFESGFGNTLGSIGVVIVLGSIIAEALKHTGAIQVITRSMVSLIGSNRMPLALTLTGFVIGVAIFSDVAFVILNPLVHSAAKTMGVSIAVMSTGLVGALQLTHAIVPPTPGPLAAAALLGADIGKTIIFGSIACLFGSMSCWAWGVYVAGPRITTQASDEFDGSDFEHSEEELPSTLSSYMPIVIPIVLIGTQSIISLVFDEGHILRTIFSYLGWPVIALSVGVWLAYRNIKSSDARERAKNEWVEAALRTSAMILVVTGSTTVGVITAASLVAPMLGTLGLSPEAAMLAGASGSVIIKYVNSSYFWVCTSLTKLSVADAVFSYGGATLVGGITSFAAVCVMWVLGFI
jgi:GntP family gluconate:H+ symporter